MTMRLGPFDGRKRRFRCLVCSKAHLKCSGKQPCTACTKRGVDCVFEKAESSKVIIHRDARAHQTTTSFQLATWKPPIAPQPVTEPEVFLFYFGDFSKYNNLTGRKGHGLAEDVKGLALSRSDSHLTDAMLSIGALQALKRMPEEDERRRKYFYSAVKHYSNAVVGLKEHIRTLPETVDDDRQTNILWTTFFLGLFELVNQIYAEAWLQHMIHGTARGLEAAGPGLCASENGRRFFMQARVMEVCRSIFFNSPTFLTAPEWMHMLRRLSVKERMPLDSLLDIIVMCTSLRVKIETALAGRDALSFEPPSEAMQAVAADGMKLRRALVVWQESYGEPIDARATAVKDEAMLLCHIFFAAVSIYLSGAFDYETEHWDGHDVQIPILSEEEINQHRQDTIDLVVLGMKASTLSPVLFLFPLHIAGARATSEHDRTRIRVLLEAIGKRFAVVTAVRNSLEVVWYQRKAVQV